MTDSYRIKDEITQLNTLIVLSTNSKTNRVLDALSAVIMFHETHTEPPLGLLEPCSGTLLEGENRHQRLLHRHDCLRSHA